MRQGFWIPPLAFLFLSIASLVLITKYRNYNYVDIKTAFLEEAKGTKPNSPNNSTMKASAASSTSVTSSETSSFVLTSPVFLNGDTIPNQYTCTDESGNTHTAISPPLDWTGAPSGTVQYLIAMSTTESDATIYDWTVYDIPATITSIPENGTETVGKMGGTNPDFLYLYRGPCSTTSGVHSYHIKVYALSADLNAVVEKGDAKSYPPHLINAVALRKWVLAEASISVNYCRCGCDGSMTTGSVCG
jgi:phosphatidylethanolamine-binding protein (PEBP) family uncharacterized protein